MADENSKQQVIDRLVKIQEECDRVNQEYRARIDAEKHPVKRDCLREELKTENEGYRGIFNEINELHELHLDYEEFKKNLRN